MTLLLPTSCVQGRVHGLFTLRDRSCGTDDCYVDEARVPQRESFKASRTRGACCARCARAERACSWRPRKGIVQFRRVSGGRPAGSPR
jgi:hypothetical protein